jgi:hypothetical protein
MPVATSTTHDLKTFVLSRHPAIAIETVEEERVEAALRTVALELRVQLFEWTITQGLVRMPGSAAVYDSADPARMLANLAELEVDGLFWLKDMAQHLSTPQASRSFRELLEGFSEPGRMSTLVLTGASVELPLELDAHVVRYELELPSQDEYRRTIAAVVASLHGSGRVQVDIAAGDYDDFARALSGMTLNQARQAISHAALQDGRLARDDLSSVTEQKARTIAESGVLEFFPASDNPAQLGGFPRLQEWLQRARLGFSPEAEALNLAPPRGVLLVGVQGCGKSLAAKYVARAWELPLLKLDAGRLYDKFIGESEKNFRRAIALAESMAPAVLWIDEIEKGLAPTGGDSDAGLSRRIFGSFLTWLQEKRKDVFVVATANDLSILPPELLRKGRFDEIFFVDLPVARSARRSSAFTWDCATRMPPASSSPASWRRATASAAPRSSRR